MSIDDLKPNEYRKFLLLAAVEKGKKLKEHFSKALLALEHIEYADDFLQTIAPGSEDMFEDKILLYLGSLKDAFDKVRGAILMSYLSFTEPDILEGMLTTTEALCDKEQKEMFHCFDVSLSVSDDVLMIKMPLLWGRYSKQDGVPKWALTKDNLPWLQWELERILQQNFDQIPTYTKRHFSYVHVLYPDQKQYTDNDNYDTKKVTDTVTSFMGGTDSALRTSFSFFSLRSGNLAPGTYLIVTNSFNDPPNLPNLEQVLMKNFPVSIGQSAPVFMKKRTPNST